MYTCLYLKLIIFPSLSLLTCNDIYLPHFSVQIRPSTYAKELIYRLKNRLPLVAFPICLWELPIWTLDSIYQHLLSLHPCTAQKQPQQQQQVVTATNTTTTTESHKSTRLLLSEPVEPITYNVHIATDTHTAAPVTISQSNTSHSFPPQITISPPQINSPPSESEVIASIEYWLQEEVFVSTIYYYYYYIILLLPPYYY